MAQNKMNEVAKLLGVELEEEFKVYGWDGFCKITEIGLERYVKERSWLMDSIMLTDLIKGTAKIVKIPKPILDEKEKEYLSAVIKPFRDRILYIAKSETVKTYSPNAKVYECIYIMYKDSSKKKNPFYMGFPCFKKGTMYKGMKLDKEYTLKELEL